MRLNDVLALRPPQDADAADLLDAIRTAEGTAKRLRAEAATANTARSGLLLTADDKALAVAEAARASAQLAAERVEAMLPGMRQDLAAAQGRETVADLQAEHAALVASVAEVRRWQAEDLPQIPARFAAHDAAAAAHAAFVRNVKDAYERPEVRDAGPLGVELPQLDGVLPRQAFPNWK